jgi:hypothetical protein
MYLRIAYLNPPRVFARVEGGSGVVCLCLVDVNKNVRCQCDQYSGTWERTVDPGGWLYYPVLYAWGGRPLTAAALSAGPIVNISNTASAETSISPDQFKVAVSQPRFDITSVEYAYGEYADRSRRDLYVQWSRRLLSTQAMPKTARATYRLRYVLDVLRYKIPVVYVATTPSRGSETYVATAPTQLGADLENAKAELLCGGQKAGEVSPPAVGHIPTSSCPQPRTVKIHAKTQIVVQYVAGNKVYHECITSTECPEQGAPPPPSPPAPPPPTSQLETLLMTVAGAVAAFTSSLETST